MNGQMAIPQGNRSITVELTVKEALALAGYRFNQDPKLSAGARRKVKQAVESAFFQQQEQPICYEALIQ